MDGDSLRRPAEAPEATAHQEQTRALVRAMMTLTGLSATGLARAAGLTPSTLNRFMHKPVRHTLSQRTMLALMTETFLQLAARPRQAMDRDALADLAPAISVYERGMLELAPDLKPLVAEAKALAGPAAQRALVPEPGAPDLPVLIGSTQGVDVQRGDFANAPLKTQRPPFLAADPKAFAILMPDDTMSPRFDAGDMLYASPARSLDGDSVDVVLDRARGGFIVARLAGITAEKVRIAALSPRATESFDRDKVRGLYRIVGVQRMGA